MNKTEIDYLKVEIQKKINNKTIKKNKNGKYKINKKFPELSQSIAARGSNAEEIAIKLLSSRDSILNATTELAVKGKRIDEITQEYYEIEIKPKQLGEDTLKTYKRNMNRIISAFGNRGIKTIKYDEIKKFISEYALTHGESTVKDLTRHIKNIFAFAHTQGYVEDNKITNIPIPRCKRTSKAVQRNSPENTQLAFKAAANDSFMLLVLTLLFSTGMRTIEAVNLQWNNISFENDYIHITKSKYTGAFNVKNDEETTRYLPLSPILKWQLELERDRHKQQNVYSTDGYILLKKETLKPMNSSELSKYFTTLHNEMDFLNGAEIVNNKVVSTTLDSKITPYSFRKDVSSVMKIRNYNDSIVDIYTGHKPKSVVDKYYSKPYFETELRPLYQDFVDFRDSQLRELMFYAGIALPKLKNNDAIDATPVFKSSPYYELIQKPTIDYSPKKSAFQNIDKLVKEKNKTLVKAKGSRKPELDMLMLLIALFDYSEIGKMYDVSDNAVRQWVQTYHIPSDKKQARYYAIHYLIEKNQISLDKEKVFKIIESDQEYIPSNRKPR